MAVMTGFVHSGRLASRRTPAKSAGAATMSSPSGPAARLFRGQPEPGAEGARELRLIGDPPFEAGGSYLITRDRKKGSI